MDNYEIKKAELKIQVLSSVAGAKGEEGESMYEIAKKNGFEGTEQEFIAQYMNVNARIGCYECDTDSSTSAKTVQGGKFILPTIPPYGGTIKVKFKYKNSAANPTLSISGCTAKPLYYDGAIASSTNTWADNETVDIYYDGTNFYANNVEGGGKFASGEKVKNVGIDNNLDISDGLPKNKAVFLATNTKTTENITSSPDSVISEKRLDSAQVIGNSIVYTDFPSSTYKVNVYNIPAKSQVKITLTTGGNYTYVLTDLNDNVLQYWWNNANIERVYNYHDTATKLHVTARTHYTSIIRDTYTPILEELENAEKYYKSVINVNFINGADTTPYESKALAHAAVPSEYREQGVVLIYLLSSGWIIEQFVGSNWDTPTETHWKLITYNKFDVIYDVTAATGQTYNDIIAAATDVPSEYRYQDSTIKFATPYHQTIIGIFQSNDYQSGWEVENNWTVFDSSLIKNSLSIKYNKGVFLTEKITREIPLIKKSGERYNRGTYIGNTQVVYTDKGELYPIIVISKTAIYKYTGVVSGIGNYGVHYYNANGVYIGSQFSSGTFENELLNIPSQAFYMAVSGVDSSTKVLKLTVTDYPDKFTEDYYSKYWFAKNYTDIDISSMLIHGTLKSNGSINISYSTGLYTDTLVQIDKTKNYIVTSYVDKYGIGVQYFKVVGETQTYLGFQISSPSAKVITEILDIPEEATHMRLSCRSNISTYLSLKTFEYAESVSKEKLLEFATELQSTYVSIEQGLTNYGKFLVVGADGKVTLGDGGGGDPTANTVKLQTQKQIPLGTELIDNPNIPAVTGWSGDLTDGLTHAANSGTDTLEVQYATVSGKSYIVQFDLSMEQPGLLFTIGTLPEIDTYNGSTHIILGIKSNGGYLKFIPTNATNTFTITNLSVKEIVPSEEADTTLTVTVGNVDNGTMTNNINGYWNIAIGYSNPLSANINGSRNIAIGYSSLGALKSGTRNIGLGTFSGSELQYGEHNIAIGADSFYKIKTGDNNIAIGFQAITGDSTTSDRHNNVAVGTRALSNLQSTAKRNVALGSYACNYVDSDNIGIGYQACYGTRGIRNVAIGTQALGNAYARGDNNIAIGYHAYCGVGSRDSIVTVNNSIAIGSGAVATESNQIVIGISSHTSIIIAGKTIKFNQDGTVSWS